MTAFVTDPFETTERRALRETVRRFTEQDVLPHVDEWERAGELPRELSQKAGKLGLLGLRYPEHVGGGGGDVVDETVLVEELCYAGAPGGVLASLFTTSITLPHLIAEGTPDQIDSWVRPSLAGDMIGALGVTEPDGGSDVGHLRTCADRDGDSFVVNGSKIFITNAARGDFVVTAVRTGGAGAAGLSLLVIPTDAKGFTVTRRLSKMGWLCSDTTALTFDDVRVPVSNLVGTEGTGFAQLSRHFVSERLGLAVQAYASAQRALDVTAQWCRDRRTFGKPLIKRQLVQHTLSEMTRKIDVARVYCRQLAVRLAAGETNLIAEACFAKNTAVENGAWVVDQAVQLHGGMGYMRECEVERIYRDFRIIGIGGGASEVLTELAAKLRGYTA